MKQDNLIRSHCLVSALTSAKVFQKPLNINAVCSDVSSVVQMLQNLISLFITQAKFHSVECSEHTHTHTQHSFTHPHAHAHTCSTGICDKGRDETKTSRDE